MTVLGRLMERRNISNPAVPLTSEALSELFQAGISNASGVTVSETKALGIAAVWRAVNLNAGTAASLPLKTYRKGTKRRTVVRLLDKPNDELTQFEFWERMYWWALLWGNAYAFKVRNNAGALVELEPCPASSVKVGKVTPDGEYPYRKVFEINIDGVVQVLSPYELLHIPGPGYDGCTGASPIRIARQSLGMSMAAEEYGARLFGSGSMMSGILQTEQRLNGEQAETLKARWKKSVAGLGKSHEIAVLGSGTKFQPISMPNTDAQFIESRRFQVTEVARWFGVPPHMLFETEKSTSWGSGIEEQTIGWVTFSLRPTWLSRFEQRATMALVPPGQYAEYAIEGILRGDSVSRAEFYAKARQWGWLTVNEIRAMENLPPVDGGDQLMQPLNMTPIAPAQDGDEEPVALPDPRSNHRHLEVI